MLTRLPAARPTLAALAVLAAAVVLASCGTAAEEETDTPGAASARSAATADPVAGIGVEEFRERVEQADVVLDVRTPQEYAAGHLPGAVNLDASAADFAARVAELDPSASYAVYCASGNRSGRALAQLREAGFTDAEHLAGGIAAWQAAGGRVTR